MGAARACDLGFVVHERLLVGSQVPWFLSRLGTEGSNLHDTRDLNLRICFGSVSRFLRGFGKIRFLQSIPTRLEHGIWVRQGLTK